MRARTDPECRELPSPTRLPSTPPKPEPQNRTLSTSNIVPGPQPGQSMQLPRPVSHRPSPRPQSPLTPAAGRSPPTSTRPAQRESCIRAHEYTRVGARKVHALRMHWSVWDVCA
eukprot:1161548-Pelagomonas_calceolata.AAC.3